jgi:hypothetical protein
MKPRNLAVLLVLFFVLPLAAQERNLSWSMALINSSRQGVSFTQPVSMRNGEIFSLNISGKAPCYVYVIAQDSKRKMSVLRAGRARAEEAITIGPMQLTPPGGDETLYVVVSLSEQTRLQEVVNAYKKSENSRNSRNLLNSIMEIRRSISRLRENPEKPVYMGGAFRGPDGQTQATEYSGLDVYVKTVIIKH